MMAWSSDLYLAEGRAQGIPDALLLRVIDAHERIALAAPSVTPLVTLGHLGHACQLSYAWLRAVVERTVNPYFTFELPKRHGGRRLIHVPERRMLLVQRWINANVLQKINVHESAYAYCKRGTLRDAAARHAGAKWMVKIDLADFFHSIGENRVFSVFYEDAAFPRLLSFELARICTVGGDFTPAMEVHYPYTPLVGAYVPIGAPTSPMISNVVMKRIDENLSALAAKNGARYGRYADDLVFTSIRRNFGRREVANILAAAKGELISAGFTINRRKLAVLPPGTRKIFLGLDVTSSTPRVPHELRRRMGEHYRFIAKFGPVTHAKKRRFSSVPALQRHLWGLISFINQVEPDLAAALYERHEAVDWPPL